MCYRNTTFALYVILLGISMAAPRLVRAHCDTMSGPVIQDARNALEKGDVTPVLKWVKPEIEADVRAAFQKTLVVRSKGAEARDLADMYFFETLVRLHREGEGAPYTGLKPAGEVEPGIAAADKAVESGSIGEVIKEIATAVADGISQRFRRVMETKKHTDESVAAGREYVEAYVTFIHYVERLHLDASGAGAEHHTETPAPETPGRHQH